MSAIWPPPEKFDILTHPSEVLRTPAEEVDHFDSELRLLARSMIRTIQDVGIGLAAPQIGVSMQLIVVDTPRISIALANPVILAHGKAMIAIEEGCLSCPGLQVRIPRWGHILITGRDLSGSAQTFEIDGLEAIVFQHEIDHLQGITILEREVQS